MPPSAVSDRVETTPDTTTSFGSIVAGEDGVVSNTEPSGATVKPVAIASAPTPTFPVNSAGKSVGVNGVPAKTPPSVTSRLNKLPGVVS